MRLLVEIYNKIVEDKVETDFYECADWRLMDEITGRNLQQNC